MRHHVAHIKEIDSVLAGRRSKRDTAVIESWKRCVDEYQLDPARLIEAYIVPDSQLREHRERSERLIAIARDSAEQLFRQIVGQNYVLLLTDEQGVTVDYFGDDTFKTELQQAGLYMGAEWSEARAGTSGVGSCLITGQPITVHQCDHFDSTHTSLSCSAAPIYNTQGQLAAVLDISLLHSPTPKVSQELALHLVKSASHRIEQASLMHDMRSEWVLCLSRSPSMVDVDSEASLALDGLGRVIGMTHTAALLLAQQAERDWRQPGSILGEAIQNFFNISINELPRLTRAFSTQQRRIVGSDNSVWFALAIDPSLMPGVGLSRVVASMVKADTPLPPALAQLSGGDQQLDKTLEKAAKVCKTALPVLLQGETGTGKEFMARAIHEASRPDEPFIAVNCAAIPANLIEGELFGHAAGAFTGASRHGRPGLIEAAEGGTLFLDEIGDMPLELQTRLLRFLSEGETLRIGAVQAKQLNVRVVAASLHNLPELVEQKHFRADLYYRLNAVELYLPPLRQRLDLPFIASRLLTKIGSTTIISEQAMTLLQQYPWPGNLRELDNVLRLAVVLAEGNRIWPRDLPDKLNSAYSQKLYNNAGTGTQSENKTSFETLKNTIKLHNGNMSRAARALGVNRSTLYRRLKRLEVST